MDKTEDTKGLSSETPGQASKGGEGITSKKEAKSYTEAEKQNAVSDALAKAGRTDKNLTDREATVKAREDANKAAQEKRDAAELAEVQGDPDKLAVYQSKQVEKQRAKSLDEREAEINRSKAEHEAEITTARETMLEIKVWQIATQYKVDPVALKNLNLPTAEQIEEVAKVMPKLSEAEATEGLTPDSAVTSGGQGEPTPEQLEKMTMAQYAAYVAKRDAKK